MLYVISRLLIVDIETCRNKTQFNFLTT